MLVVINNSLCQEILWIRKRRVSACNEGAETGSNSKPTIPVLSSPLIMLNSFVACSVLLNFRWEIFEHTAKLHEKMFPQKLPEND